MKKLWFLLIVAAVVLLLVLRCSSRNKPGTAEEALERERAELLSRAPVGSDMAHVQEALESMGYTVIREDENPLLIGRKSDFFIQYHPILIRTTYDALLKCHFERGKLTRVDTELYVYPLI